MRSPSGLAEAMVRGVAPVATSTTSACELLAVAGGALQLDPSRCQHAAHAAEDPHPVGLQAGLDVVALGGGQRPAPGR